MFAPLIARTGSKPAAVTGEAKAPAGWGLPPRGQSKLVIGRVDDPLEAEADRIAEQVLHRDPSE